MYAVPVHIVEGEFDHILDFEMSSGEDVDVIKIINH
jgi:hypothetical protein